jgi:hypothetical protein
MFKNEYLEKKWLENNILMNIHKYGIRVLLLFAIEFIGYEVKRTENKVKHNLYFIAVVYGI